MFDSTPVLLLRRQPPNARPDDAAARQFFVDLPSQGFGRVPPEWVPGAPSDGLSLENDAEAGSAAWLCSAAAAAARANRPGCRFQLPGGNRARAQDRCCNCCQECVLDDLLTHGSLSFHCISFHRKPDEFLPMLVLLIASRRGQKALRTNRSRKVLSLSLQSWILVLRNSNLGSVNQR